MKDNECIFSAFRRWEVETLWALLQDPRVNPAARGHSIIHTGSRAMYWTSDSRYGDMIKMLLADGRVDFNINNNEFIVGAINKKESCLVECLLQHDRFKDMGGILLDDIRVTEKEFLKKTIDYVKILQRDVPLEIKS